MKSRTTLRQKAVADAILEGKPVGKALAEGGYGPGYPIGRSEAIQGYLAEARSELSGVSTLKRIDVLGMFLEAYELARAQSDPAQMISGAREIGKMMGYYEPERLSVELGRDAAALVTRYRQLSDAELLEIASGRNQLTAEVIEPIDAEPL